MSICSFGEDAHPPLTPVKLHFSLRHVVVHIPSLSSSNLAQECTHIIHADTDNGLQNRDVALQTLGAASTLEVSSSKIFIWRVRALRQPRKGYPVGTSYCDMNRDTYDVVFFRCSPFLASSVGETVLGISVRETARKV